MNTHPFDLKFVSFCPKFSGDSYVEFQEKTISREFFRNLCKPRLCSTKIWDILPYFLQFYFGSRHHWRNQKIITQVLWYVVYTQLGRHVHKQIIKRKYREEIQDHLFCKTSFFHTRSRIYYALLLGCFGVKYLPDTRHCEFWIRHESQICSTRFSINDLIITAKAEREVICVWNCLIFVLGE